MNLRFLGESGASQECGFVLCGEAEGRCDSIRRQAAVSQAIAVTPEFA